jgi:hypothetical protein
MEYFERDRNKDQEKWIVQYGSKGSNVLSGKKNKTKISDNSDCRFLREKGYLLDSEKASKSRERIK